MKYPIQENDILILVPVSIKKLFDDYLIIKKEDRTTLTTPKAGAKVVELIALGEPPHKIKEIISKEFSVDVSTVNITPILESLVDNGFISQIGDHVIFRERPRLFVNAKYFLTVILSGNPLELLKKMGSIELTYLFLKKCSLKKYRSIKRL